MKEITERVLVHSDGHSVTAIYVAGDTAEFDDEGGIAEGDATWQDVLGDPPNPGFWIFEGVVHRSPLSPGSEYDDEVYYEGDYRKATEDEVIRAVRGEALWPKFRP